MARKSRVIPIAVAVAVVALAFALNPSAERHRSEIRQAVAERGAIQRVLGLGALTAFVSSYHSLGLASYTTAGERTLSVGAFGLVFVPSP
jgi:hypothetical protein